MVGVSGLPQTAIRTEGLGFSHADSGRGIEDVTFTVDAGDMLAIVGPNGAGKSTLLELLAGSLVPDRGSVEVAGMVPSKVGPGLLARRLAMLGQHGPLGFPFTVLEVVLMGRAPHVEGFRLESDHDLEVATRAMASTGVEDLASRTFDALSSGERQRVALARALAQEPELLLLDEPAVFLDVKQQARLYQLFARLNRERGMTIVAVLHDLNLAARYFSGALLIDGGRAVAVGDSAEVLSAERLGSVFGIGFSVFEGGRPGSRLLVPDN